MIGIRQMDHARDLEMLNNARAFRLAQLSREDYEPQVDAIERTLGVR